MKFTVLLVVSDKSLLKELESLIPWDSLSLSLVSVASDGKMGEALIKRYEPDIVIAELNLGGKDALTMLASSSASYSVIISDTADYESMRAALRLGVSDFLSKPVERRQIEEVLSVLIEKIKKDRQVEEEVDEDLIPLPKTVGNHIINSAIEFISNNYYKPIGLQAASESLGLSESHLSRLFKEETGLNFLQYLNAWRINKAVVMMKDPRKNISEIASSCGFPTAGYFAKIFKRFSGYTPTEYRNQL